MDATNTSRFCRGGLGAYSQVSSRNFGPLTHTDNMYGGGSIFTTRKRGSERSPGAVDKGMEEEGERDNNDVVFAALIHRRPNLGGCVAS